MTQHAAGGQSEERARKEKLLLTPRSDDEAEEEDPLAKKRKNKDLGKDAAERPGSRASSAKSGTSSHAASRHDRPSPRASGHAAPCMLSGRC